jgi:tRNA nucleotidyltransferase (CCA-adding enzyme)
VFQHTLDVLSKTEPVLVQRLMGLFHDIGKTVTRTVDPETSGVHFYGHEMEGEKMVEEIMSRLKYPRELIDSVKLGVRNHMRLKQAGDVGVKMKDKTLLKFRNEMGEQLENILNLMHADNIAHSEASSMPNQIAGIRKRLETLKNVPTKPKMPISGFDLQKMGLKPGPLFKDIMNAVTEAWYENPGLSKEEALAIAEKVAAGRV